MKLAENNFIIFHPAPTFEEVELNENKKMNILFKLNIRKQIKKAHAKEFHFTKNNLFVYR